VRHTGGRGFRSRLVLSGIRACGIPFSKSSERALHEPNNRLKGDPGLRVARGLRLPPTSAAEGGPAPRRAHCPLRDAERSAGDHAERLRGA
jgi:hypothetical protein